MSTTSSGPLHVHRYGTPGGPPLLALHGITGHGRRWEALATGPWAHHDVLAPDLRGHGTSPWTPPWSMPTLVDDVLATLDAAGQATVDVVGHSYGGLLALELLARAPERVRRVVLLDPGLARDPELMRVEAEKLIATDGYATRDEALAARNAGLGDTIHPAVAVEADQHLVAGEDGRFRYRYSRPMVVTAFSELSRPLPSFPERRPVLLVVATAPRIVAPAVEDELRAALADQLTVTTIDCGHMVYWERFDDTARLVAGFLTPAG